MHTDHMARISKYHNRFCRPSEPIQRTQRFPSYSDRELEPFFAEVAKGYCYKQAAARCLYPAEWVLNTLYSDDDIAVHMLNLSMMARAQIETGKIPAPKRWDGLYDQYLP